MRPVALSPMYRPEKLSFTSSGGPSLLPLMLVLFLGFISDSRAAAVPVVALSPASANLNNLASSVNRNHQHLSPLGAISNTANKFGHFPDSVPQPDTPTITEPASPETPQQQRQRQREKQQIPAPVTTVYVMVVDAPQPTDLPVEDIDHQQQQGRQRKIDDPALSDVAANASPTTTTDSAATDTSTPQPTIRTFFNTDNSNIALPVPTLTPLTQGQYAGAWIATAVLAFLTAIQGALAAKLFPQTAAAGGSSSSGHDSRPTSIMAPDNNIPHHKFKSFISESSAGPTPPPSPPTLLSRIGRSSAYMFYKGFAAAVFYALVVVAATLNVGLLCAIVVGAMLGAFVTEMCRTARSKALTGANNAGRRSADEEYTPYLIGG
ncbi:hypothetical protein HDU86_004228 [Geranomyces michiganensis]|nr:hypothetical protein HDU86_004228 [Geranomyces michiganensis]